MPSAKSCKDCIIEGVTTKRKPAMTKHGQQVPGGRCVTHHRLERKRLKLHAHGKRVEHSFGISAADYWRIYEAQGGCCFICRRARGLAKRLAVDHDHHREGCQHAPDIGCRNCVRALLCSPCNRQIGWWNSDALLRAIEVLRDPPAQKVLSGAVKT